MLGVKYIGPVFDHCYSADTEVLTDSGWKFFPDVKYSDQLATLSDGHNLEYHHPDKLVSTPWEGDLLHFYSRDGVDLLVSPNHKMYVQTESSRRKLGESSGWKLEDACDSFGSTRYYKKNASRYFKRGPETINIGGREIKTEEWLEFLGYYLSEGSATTTKRKDYIVQIRQTKDDVVLARMEYALSKVTPNKTNIRPDGRVIVNDKDLCLYLKETFGHCYTKYVPRGILNGCSREQLSILYDALVVGDGKLTPDDESGGSYYATSSVQLKDDFQELQLKVGLSGDSHVAARPGDTTYLKDGRKITCTTDLWKIYIRRKRGGTLIKSDNCSSKPAGYSNFGKSFYKGTIYCATVKNHVMYVRRNGKALWCGNSGYGEASRNYVLALHRAGVPITLQPHCFERDPPDVGTAEDRAILKSLVAKNLEFDTVIVHLTPDHLPKYAKQYKDKHLISYTVWETSLLHPKWAADCNHADEVWVPCEWNVRSFRESGVTVPIHKVHHGIDVGMYDNISEEEIAATGMGGSTFTFLSVMQWNFRKNPEGLLRAYFNAFSPKDDVRLLIKAYIGRGQPPAKEAALIKEVVTKIKNDMQLPGYPRVSLITETLPSDKLRALYAAADAYVSLTHGEGFGLTMFEAGLAGKPVIATNKGGNMEYMNSENSYPVPAEWDYVYGMSTFNPWYLGNQQWARPSLPIASELMRHVFENRDVAATKGAALRELIKSEFSWDKVAGQMIALMQER